MWPHAPEGKAGGSWRTIRNDALCVSVFVPTHATLESFVTRGVYPMATLTHEGVTATISVESGSASFAEGLSSATPTLVGQAVVKISRKEGNTTVLVKNNGMYSVTGWVRGAQCEVISQNAAEAQLGFDMCADLRVPPPGPLVQAHPWFPLLPQMAEVVETSRVSKFYLGHVHGRVLQRSCPSMSELQEANPSMIFSTQPGAAGSELMVGVGVGDSDGRRYTMQTTVWGAAGRRCCIASIPESLESPTEAQVDYLVRICGG
jgi:hypothetical protein